VAASAVFVASQGSAATLYVSADSTNPVPPYATPATAADNIQAAVDVATNGDTVLVEPGQYDLTNQITITESITLRSIGKASATFLNALDPTWCLWISNSVAVIDGCTIQNQGGSSVAAGGVLLVGGTVQNCAFTNFLVDGPGPGNSVTMTGGILSNSVVYFHRIPPEFDSTAVYCTEGGLVTDCQLLISGGGQGVGIYLENSQMRNSVVLGTHQGCNCDSGQAVNALGSTITDCTIANNWSLQPGGGAYLNSCLMDRCVLAYNTSTANGGGIFETNSTIRDSLIVSNSANISQPGAPSGLGGGVYMQGGALVNCTVSEDSAEDNECRPGQGGGVYVESGGITNSIIYFNYATVGANWTNAATGVFDHSCTTPDPGGAGNIVQDPQFVAPTDFHLATNSPCIAAGVVQSWMTGAFDLDGNPRTTNGVVGMGAYQSPTAGAPAPVKANFVASPRSGEAPLSVQFKDASTGPVAAWNWNFGDGATSALRNPSHTYFDRGDHMVTLVVTGSGASSTNGMAISVQSRRTHLANPDQSYQF
jgi:PKD repeat protein